MQNIPSYAVYYKNPDGSWVSIPLLINSMTDENGVITIEHGGTGATDPIGARSNLDVFSTTETDIQINNVLTKTPYTDLLKNGDDYSDTIPNRLASIIKTCNHMAQTLLEARERITALENKIQFGTEAPDETTTGTVYFQYQDYAE